MTVVRLTSKTSLNLFSTVSSVIMSMRQEIRFDSSHSEHLSATTLLRTTVPANLILSEWPLFYLAICDL